MNEELEYCEDCQAHMVSLAIHNDFFHGKTDPYE